MREITFEKLLSMAGEEVHGSLANLACKDHVEGFIVFENLAFDSSAFGDRTFVIYGPGHTYKQPDDAIGKWLHDLPSQRQYPTAFCKL